jgi:hypothetical protein
MKQLRRLVEFGHICSSTNLFQCTFPILSTTVIHSCVFAKRADFFFVFLIPSKIKKTILAFTYLRLQEISDRPIRRPLNTCTAHSGAKKAHDWMVDQLPVLFRTTHKVKTQQVVKSRGQPCGDIELTRISSQRGGSGDIGVGPPDCP